MKKITLLLVFLVASLSYSQQGVIQDFENGGLGEPFGGSTASIVPDPQEGGTRGMVAQLNSVAGQMIWQGININLNKNVDLTTNKSMTLDIYSLVPITIAPKIVGGLDGAPDSTAAVSHPGGGWQTVTVTFNQGLDNTTIANGEYNVFVIFLNWNLATNGFTDPSEDRTFFVDNISGVGVVPAETCIDGIMNNGETGIDCGGPNCEPCDPMPTSPASDPAQSVEDADVLSIFNDEGKFTNSYATDFAFGTEFRSIIDLDNSDGVDNVVKLELDRGGWGAGNNTEVDLASQGFSHFNFSYYMPTLDPGTEGHLLQVTLVSRTPGQDQDPDAVYNITGEEGAPNSNAVLEFDKWVNVSVPLADFTNFNTNLLLYKFGTPSTAFSPLVYLDNIFFSKSEVVLNLSNNQLENFKMYPNPVTNRLNVNANTTIKSMTIFNILGAAVKSSIIQDSKASINVSDLNTGIYIVKFKINGQVTTQKFIKQ